MKVREQPQRRGEKERFDLTRIEPRQIHISSIIMVHDTDGVRMPERVKAGKFVINGVSLASAEKTIENGKKIVAFRTEKTVAATSHLYLVCPSSLRYTCSARV